jgi:hypothetical protein
MRSLFPFLSVWAVVASAADPEFTLDARVNLEDRRELHIAATVADESTSQLHIAGNLYLEVKVEQRPDVRLLWATLYDRSGATERKVTQRATQIRPGGTFKLLFSICGEQTIVLTYAAAAPGRCADLRPMARADPVFGCEVCTGLYEGMPTVLTSRARIAPISEPGEQLTINGRALGPDGKPRAGVVIYAYQTDRFGIYPNPAPPRSDVSDFEGTLRGWVRTDAQGRYTFDTIRPASYPNSDNPQHVHMHVAEPGCATYMVDEMMFTDDPLYQRLAADTSQRHRIGSNQGGSGVVTPRRRGAGWEVTRDIHLGQNIKEYTGCAK